MEQVAVFLDFENLAIGAEETLTGRSNPVPYEALELVCRDYGHAVIRRAYADWSKPQFGRYQEDLALNGVDLIQVKRFGMQQKNAADIRMAVDAMETVIAHPGVSTFMLVAGDGDYSPLVQKLREFGKKVVGVGTEASASRRLVSVCSEYKYWATLVAAVDPTARPAVAAEFNVEEARPLLITALSESTTSPCLGSWLKLKMLSLDPSFDERNYACRNFRAFLDVFSDVVEVVKPDGDGDVHVSLLDNAGSLDPAVVDAAVVKVPSKDDHASQILRTLRQRGMDFPTQPAARDALLSSVHDAWRSGRLRTVADISDVLLDDDTGHVPNARTRGPLRLALVSSDTAPIPLPQPEQREMTRLAEYAIGPWDGSSCDDWVREAHVSWLAVALTKLADEPDLEERLLDAFFPEAENYGEELLPLAVARVQKRALNR